MTKDDLTFLREHAMAYAAPAGIDAAQAYADWYIASYVYPDATMEDMPSHSYAWHDFLESASLG